MSFLSFRSEHLGMLYYFDKLSIEERIEADRLAEESIRREHEESKPRYVGHHVEGGW